MSIVPFSATHLHEAAILMHGYQKEHSSLSPEDHAQALALYLELNAGQAFLALQEHQAVGWIALHSAFSFSKGKPYLVVQELYVDPAFRHRGIARAMLDVAEEQARKLGACRIQLDTGTENQAARNLYENTGFELMQNRVTYALYLP